MLRIAVNTRLLLPNKLEGIGWFTLESLKRITTRHPEVEFYFFFDRPYSDEFIFSGNITPVVLFPQARHPFLYYWWFEYAVPKALNHINADLFLSPDGYLSLSANTPSVAVMHDLNFEHYPQDLPWLEQKYYRYFFPGYARKANRIATVSEYSKGDISRCYEIDPAKIDVVYNGVNEIYRPLSSNEQKPVRAKYANGSPYFLFVGALLPRKNLGNLFRAFDQFKASDSNDYKLLIAGEKKWWTGSIRQSFEEMKHKESVSFTGRMAPDDLKDIIASAFAMVYVSSFEGFGIPILEAMNCDIPVITSNVTSMPEVAGDAALLVDPFSMESICNALLQLSKDEALRQQLIEKGRKQRQKFSWDQTAEKLWQCMEKSLKSI